MSRELSSQRGRQRCEVTTGLFGLFAFGFGCTMVGLGIRDGNDHAIWIGLGALIIGLFSAGGAAGSHAARRRSQAERGAHSISNPVAAASAGSPNSNGNNRDDRSPSPKHV